jgi:hypothetical protein
MAAKLSDIGPLVVAGVITAILADIVRRRFGEGNGRFAVDPVQAETGANTEQGEASARSIFQSF